MKDYGDRTSEKQIDPGGIIRRFHKIHIHSELMKMFLILMLLLRFAEITVAQTRETVRLSISGKIHTVDNRALSYPSILKQHHDHCCSSFKHSSIILKKYLRIEATLSVKHGGMFFVNSCSFFQNILLQFVARFQLVWC